MINSLLSANLLLSSVFSSGLTLGILLILFAIISLMVGFYFIVKAHNIDSNNSMTKINVNLVIAILLLVGLVIRIVFACFVKGFRNDFNYLVGVTNNFINNKFSNYYIGTGKIEPLSYYLVVLFGGLARTFGANVDGIFFQLMVKLPFILCDIGLAIILYFIAKKYYNQYMGLTILGIVCINPIFFVSSAIWASTIPLFVLLIVLSLYFLINKKILLTHIFYMLSVLAYNEAILLYPLFFIYFIYTFIKGIKLSAKAHKPFNEIMGDQNLAVVISIPFSFILSFVLMYIIVLPMIISDFSGNIFLFLNRLINMQFVKLEYFSYNALSIFNIFGKNGVAISQSFPSYIFSIIFTLIILAMVIIIYVSKKNRILLVLLSAFILLTLQSYYLNFSAISTISVLVLLMLSFILSRDRRILKVFSLVGISFIINTMLVMVSGGQLNNLSLSALTELSLGTNIVNGGFSFVMLIICTIVTIISHVYYTLIILDISMSNHRVLLDSNYKSNNFIKAQGQIFKF